MYGLVLGYISKSNRFFGMKDQVKKLARLQTSLVGNDDHPLIWELLNRVDEARKMLSRIQGGEDCTE